MKNITTLHEKLLSDQFRQHPLLKEWHAKHRLRCIPTVEFKDRDHKIVEFSADPERTKKFNTSGYHVYFVPNASKAKKGSFTNESKITGINYLFADYDIRGELTKRELAKEKNKFIRLLKNKMPVPTVIVDSGYGVHVYWKVTKSFPKNKFTEYQKRIAAHLGTDSSVCDLPRIMRLPGTFNVKHGKRVFCKVVESNDTGAYRRNSFRLPKLKSKRGRPRKEIKLEGKVVSSELPAGFLTLVEHCPKIKEFWGNKVPKIKKKGRRSFSEDDFQLAVMLLEAFYSVEDIAAVIANNTKCLHKFRGNPAGRQRYVETTINSVLSKNECGYSQVILTTYPKTQPKTKEPNSII